MSFRLCLKSWNTVCSHSKGLCSVKPHLSFGSLRDKCEYKSSSSVFLIVPKVFTSTAVSSPRDTSWDVAGSLCP